MILYRCKFFGTVWGAIVLASSWVAVAGAVEPGVLVGDVFVHGYDGWNDTWPPGTIPAFDGQPDWGVLLTDGNPLIECSNAQGGRGLAPEDGRYTPFLMVNSSVTPANYTLSATLAARDDDGMGLVFGYQSNDDYFRVGVRKQADESPNMGFPQGVSVQKIVGGEIAPLGRDLTFLPPADGTRFDVDVVVLGKEYIVTVNEEIALMGQDDDLQPGRYGVLSWGQQKVKAAYDPYWGTMVDRVSVASETLSVTHAFGGAVPVKWRQLRMADSMGNTVGDGGQIGQMLGNFRADFRTGTIEDSSNGFGYARQAYTDFIAPSVVIDDPASAGWTDYEMTARLTNGDDDGIGVLVRVQDDDTFYRINFTTQSSADVRRPHEGMSIQKCKDGVWSEVYHEAEESIPLFLPADNVPFDLKVRVEGAAINVEVIKNPDTAATVIRYPTVIDTAADGPILSGSVGLTSWGNGYTDHGALYSVYGGIEGTALVTAVPEPALSVTLLALALGALASRRLPRKTLQLAIASHHLRYVR